MADRLDFRQAGFNGGINLFLDPSRIGDNEYVFARNVRARNDTLEPTKDHAKWALPTIIGDGLLQGLIAFGDWIILFMDGEAYYCTYDTLGVWTKINTFLMSIAADIIYTCQVPISNMNFQREATAAGDALAGAKFNAATTINGTISGIVCQDGGSQPWIIYESGGGLVARELATYADWDNADVNAREYVPVGLHMVYSDGRLYVASADRTTVYRSVTGRPLDFVVNIETTGNKGGDASTTAYAVSSSPITCLRELNNNSLFVATEEGQCYAMTPNYDVTIWGEPIFNRTYLFQAGCLNQFSFVDILGDFAFIDSEGLRSFNAVLQQQNEGRNSIFSQKIAAAFKGITQLASNVSAVNFDNYAIFSVRSRYGRNLVVYDTLYQTFVSFDTSPFGGIKQFAVVNTTGSKKLLAISKENILVELYGGSNYALAYLKTREWTSGDPQIELKTESLRAIWTNKTTRQGEATSVVYIDGRSRPYSQLGRSKKIIPTGTGGLLYVVTYPALWGSSRTLVNNVFPHNGGVGFKVSYTLTWDNGALLTHLVSNNIAVKVKQAQSGQIANF